MSENTGDDTSTQGLRDNVKMDEGSQKHPITRDTEFKDDAPAKDVPSEPRAGGAGQGDNLPLSGLR